MSTPKHPTREELDMVVDFLDQQLRPQNSWSIKDEYPLVFSESNRGNILMVENNNEILSHAVSKYLIVKTPVGIFKIGAIGSVVTNPLHRNQGHSQAVLQSALNAAVKHKCDIAILWTDIYDFYRKLGFELSGSEISLTISDSFSSPPQQLRIECTNQVSPDALLKLYNQHLVGTVRTIMDIKAYLKIPNMKVYTAWDKHNQIVAYAVEGKGADLSGYVHEWGGGVSELMALFKYIQNSQNRTITVISPNHSKNLIRQCKLAGATINNGFLGMIKLLDTKNLFFKIKRYARTLGIDNFILEKQGDSFVFGDGKNKKIMTTSERELVQIIFGQTDSAQFKIFDPETKRILQQIFPIPMWIWGWDSI